jgi:hypothetical protein
MVVRRHAPGGGLGYGSFGGLFFTSDPVTFNLLTEAAFIADVLTPAYAHLISIRSRWKFELLSATAGKTQIYDATIGKARYGSVQSFTSQYVCVDEFVSFPACAGQLNSSMLQIINQTPQDPLPCDEPPSDSPITIVTNAEWFPKSTQVFGTNFYGGSLNTPLNTADKYRFTPVRSVSGFVFGGSYSWQVVKTYDTEVQFNNAGSPPIINL